jgi:hypothetical protein
MEHQANSTVRMSMCTCTTLVCICISTISCLAGQGKTVRGACTLHAGTCIVSDVFQQQLREQILSEARQAAETAQQQRRATVKTASTSQPSAGQQKPSNTKSGEDSTSEKACMQPDQVPQPHWLGSCYSMPSFHWRKFWHCCPCSAVTYCLCFAVSASKCKAGMSVRNILALHG